MTDRLRVIRRAFLALLCLLSIASTAGASEAADPATLADIEYLLDRVEHSEFVFIRNGNEHSGAEAARHMRRKYEYFLEKGDIVTVEDFIDLAGTKSLMTGRQYLVRLSDDTVVPTADWLRGELGAHHNSTAGVGR